MDLFVKNILIKVVLRLVKFCSVYVHVIVQSSWCPAELCRLFGFQSQWYYLLSISHALEYLHKQQYLIGLARTHITINTMHFLKFI